MDWSTVQLAARYIREHSAWRHIKIVGFDEIPASLELLRDGYITAIFVQAAERQAYEAIRMLVDFLNGKQICSVDTGIGRLDNSNVAQYLAGSPPIQEVKQGLMAPVVDRFLAKGIPVVTYNSDNPQSGRLAFVGQEESGDATALLT